MDVAAKYYPEGSVACLDVMTVGNDLGMLSIYQSGDLLLQAMADDFSVQDKLGNLPREVSIAGHGLLVIETSPEVDHWLDGSKRSGFASRLEQSTRLVLLSIVLVPLCLYGLFKYVLPQVAIVFAEYVPDAAVEQASQQTAYVLEKAMFEESTLALELREDFQDYWLNIAEQIELQYPVKPVNFRASEIGPNALALPDGTIYMTDDLVELFDKDFELMAAVMLHEIGHVEYRHSMRMVAESLVATIALTYVFGDVSGVLELFGGVTTAVVQNQFTQKNEWEADNFAIDNLQAIGLAPDAFAKAMEKLSTLSSGEHAGQEYLQSHPLTSKRIENARRLVEQE